MDVVRTSDDLGVAHSWGTGPEVIFLSSPLADPVSWSLPVRDGLLAQGFKVTTFEHRPERLDWRNVVDCVRALIERRSEPVALVGWSQGAAIAQEVALASEQVRCAALLATYGRQSEIDKTFQQCWHLLAEAGSDLDCIRLALGFLTAFPAERLADDQFVRHMRSHQYAWAGRPGPNVQRRAAAFIASYQNRLAELADLQLPCLVMGFELDTDTFASRAREVAETLPNAEYVEVTGLGHAAPVSEPERVWPRVVEFLREHHRDA